MSACLQNNFFDLFTLQYSVYIIHCLRFRCRFLHILDGIANQTNCSVPLLFFNLFYNLLFVSSSTLLTQCKLYLCRGCRCKLIALDLLSTGNKVASIQIFVSTADQIEKVIMFIIKFNHIVYSAKVHISVKPCYYKCMLCFNRNVVTISTLTYTYHPLISVCYQPLLMYIMLNEYMLLDSVQWVACAWFHQHFNSNVSSFNQCWM